MSSGYFGDIGRISYEGPESSNPLAFRHYDPDEKVLGKRMEESSFRIEESHAWLSSSHRYKTQISSGICAVAAK